MCFGETEHHHTFCVVHAEEFAADEGGEEFGKGACHHHDEHHHGCLAFTEHRGNIDQHAHTYQEVGDEEGIADEFDAIHQWGGVGHKAVEHQTCQEGSEDALQPAELSGGCCKEHHCEGEGELYDGIAEFTEKGTDEAWQQEEHADDEEGELHGKECPKPEASCSLDGAGDACQEEQGGKECHHRGGNGDGHGG